MKLSKTIDQTRISTICKKSYDDPLGYFCMGFFFTCPDGQVTHKFHLSNGRFHLSRTIGQTLLSRPAVSEETIYQKSTNQKQELSVAAMFDNGSARNKQSLERTCHRCFLLSFGSFVQVVSEKIFFNRPIRNMFFNSSEQIVNK